MAACVVGLLALLALTVHSAQRIADKQASVAKLMTLDERIDTFSSASDSLLLLGADPGLWQAYRTEALELQQALERLGETQPDANKAAHRTRVIAEAVESTLIGLDDATATPTRGIEPLDVPVRSRIAMQQIANHGVALDTALDTALSERRQAIQREGRRVGMTLAAAALLLGAACVLAFGLIHRRMALPARALVATLERIRAGETAARATGSGNDELSRVAQTLNTLLDERDTAESQLRDREQRLETALAELKSTRDRLVRAQAVARIGSWEVDLAAEQLEWSDQVFEIFGIDREDFAGTEEAFFEMVHPDDREWLERKRAEWLDRRGDLHVEHRIVRPDGEVRWVRARARVMTGTDGTPTHTTGTVQDITESVRQQAEIRQLQQLVEGGEDLCAIVDDAYRYRWANQAYLDHYGLTREEIQGRTMQEVLGTAYFRDEVKPRVDRCLAGDPQRFETERVFADTGSRKLLARYYPIDLPDAAPRRVAAVITDVTQIREAKAELARQARLLEIAGRAARFGGWSVDLHDDTCTWSDVTAEIHAMPHGYSPSVEEGIGFYAPEYRDRIRERFTACAEQGRPYDEELQIVDAQGRRRWVRAVGEPVRDEHGAIVRVQGAFQDISAGKELEFERQRLESRLAAMLESITDAFFAIDEQWRYTYVNTAAASWTGTPPDEMLGTSLWTQFPELTGTDIEAMLSKVMTERVPCSIETYYAPLKAWFDLRAYPWQEGVAVFFRDITEQRRMVERLKEQETELRKSREALEATLRHQQALINSLPAHIAVLDAYGNVIDVNDQWRHYGERNDNADAEFGVGRNYIAVCEQAVDNCAEEARQVAAGLREVLSGQAERFELEYPCHSPDHQQWFRVVFNRLGAEAGGGHGAVAMHVDVTERKLAELELERIAFEDPLTGLLSRTGFDQRLQALLDEGGWPSTGVVAMLDVVNLRDVNEAHGYAVGDRLLIELAGRLRDRAGSGGLVGRVAGDEFVVYAMPGAASSVEETLASVTNAVDRPFELDGVIVDIDVDAGYTPLNDARRPVENLIREAELALFENRAGPNSRARWVGFTAELNERVHERVQMTSELRHALDADEFELHFQPKVDLGDGRLLAAEALLRWQHPERGLQPPGRFIPVAEQSQLIGPIGNWALRAACRHLRDWQAGGLDVVRVSVNVSLVQFLLGDFPAEVRRALDDFGVSPASLSLEITESVFERHSEQLLAAMRELHDLGVRLSLDDFGTGYSSLLYLQRYPFDEVKIDRAFTAGLLDDRFSRDIVLSVMNVAEAIGAEVVAEGIESPEIAQALLRMGCRIGQGFHYSIPLEAEDFRWLLEKRSTLPLEANA